MYITELCPIEEREFEQAFAYDEISDCQDINKKSSHISYSGIEKKIEELQHQINITMKTPVEHIGTIVYPWEKELPF